MQYLRDHGVNTIPGVMNAHQEAPYKAAKWSLPQSEQARANVILLPSYVGLEEKDIRRIADLLKNVQSKVKITQ